MRDPVRARNGRHPKSRYRLVGDVVRCLDCELVQFVTVGAHCRRCRKPYVDPATKPIVLPEPGTFSCPGEPIRGLQTMPFVLRVLRLAKGLSQKQAAVLLGCPRTYVSKIENGRAQPSLRNLARLCDGASTASERYPD